eukprot:7311224-Pyramimonas_sp.AAC.1
MTTADSKSEEGRGEGFVFLASLDTSFCRTVFSCTVKWKAQKVTTERFRRYSCEGCDWVDSERLNKTVCAPPPHALPEQLIIEEVQVRKEGEGDRGRGRGGR